MMGLPISQDILNLTPYSPGKPIEEVERELGVKAVKLASNENPLGPSPKALIAVRRVLPSVHRYPEGSGAALREALARRYRLNPAGVVLGNGSNEIIELLVRALIAPGDEAVMADRTFVVYRMVVQAARGRAVTVPLKDGRHDLAEFARRLGPRTRLVFICNPNNPTGTIVRRAEVEAFLKNLPEAVVPVVDEAYFEYVTDSEFPDMLGHLRAGRNLVVLRTFSKIYGLAALRIGYGLTTPEIADVLHRVRQPFNTNRVAQAAALASLADREHVRKSQRVNREGKRMLCDAFRSMGLEYYPSEANFVYVNVARDGRAVFSALLKQGVIVRHMDGSFLRVTIGLPHENRKFIRALQRVLEPPVRSARNRRGVGV